MTFATFSGPIRAGTQRYNTPNVGLVTLAQTVTVPFTAMLTSPTAQPLFVLPAGTKIIRINVEVVTALATATNVGLTLGNAAYTGSNGSPVAAVANSVVTTFNTGATVGKVAQATVDTAMQLAVANNVGLVDYPITGTFTAATGNATAGSIVVTVEYMQRNADGTSVPTYANA